MFLLPKTRLKGSSVALLKENTASIPSELAAGSSGSSESHEEPFEPQDALRERQQCQAIQEGDALEDQYPFFGFFLPSFSVTH